MNFAPETLTFHVRPSDQGQIIEIAYAFDSENDRLIRRTTDRSARTSNGAPIATSTYSQHPMPRRPFEPWNNSKPPITGWRMIR